MTTPKPKMLALGPLPILLHPEDFAEPIPVKMIVADKKVYKEGVEHFVKALKAKEDVGTIVVVKHPKKRLFAVLDGHHRFWAQKEFGVKIISCAVIQDYTGLTFLLTQKGFYQPSPEITKNLRAPIKKWGAEILIYLKMFKEDPISMLGERLKNGPRWKRRKKTVEEDDLI
jgi:hypothetical protein